MYTAYTRPLWVQAQYRRWWPIISSSCYNSRFLSVILISVPSYNSSARTPRKTPSPVVKNTCLLDRYLAMVTCELHRKHLLRPGSIAACAYFGCCLEMGWHVTICFTGTHFVVSITKQHKKTMLSSLQLSWIIVSSHQFIALYIVHAACTDAPQCR
jgi:hypothetical protein